MSVKLRSLCYQQTHGSYDVVLTPSTFNNGTTITFTDQGDACVLIWLGSSNGGWNVISNIGGTILS